MPRTYRYVGPAEVREAAKQEPPGAVISSPDDLRAWLAANEAGATEHTLTYVVSTRRELLVAPQRSEHVACARGESVLAAGELTVRNGKSGALEVTYISNQSTGYCPDATCWESVQSVLDRAGLPHPSEFTLAFTFRRCPACGERNLVKEDWFVCALCDAELPSEWNF